MTKYLERDQWKSPVSGEVMQEVDREGLKLHYDPVSEGYWLENGELQTLAEIHHSGVEPVNTGTFHKIVPSGKVCPQDGSTELVRVHFGEHSGIELDICPECKGIWLDPGELQKVIWYLEANPYAPELENRRHDDEHLSLTDRIMLFLYNLVDHPPLY